MAWLENALMPMRAGLLAAALALLAPGVARAAEIAWRAPAECQRADAAKAQVEKLVGQELAAIEGIAFEVEITAGRDGAHRVELRTLSSGSAPRSRELTGPSCAEVTDAISVAIALTISEQRAGETPAAEGVAEPGPDGQGATAAASEPGPRLALGIALLVDTGALPDPVGGMAVQAAFELALLRLGAFVAVFIPQDAELADGPRGGRFELVLAGLDACGHPAFGPLHLFACAGFELGRIAARGDGVRNERDGDAGWYAPRFELGAGYAFAEMARVWLRGGLAIPLARPQFVLDDVDTVHQPAGTSFRGLLAMEILL